MSYLFKVLKNWTLNPIGNGILFLSINRWQHCKLSIKDQLNYVLRSPAEVEITVYCGKNSSANDSKLAWSLVCECLPSEYK